MSNRRCGPNRLLFREMYFVVIAVVCCHDMIVELCTKVDLIIKILYKNIFSGIYTLLLSNGVSLLLRCRGRGLRRESRGALLRILLLLRRILALSFASFESPAWSRRGMGGEGPKLRCKYCPLRWRLSRCRRHPQPLLPLPGTGPRYRRWNAA